MTYTYRSPSHLLDRDTIIVDHSKLDTQSKLMIAVVVVVVLVVALAAFNFNMQV